VIRRGAILALFSLAAVAADSQSGPSAYESDDGVLLARAPAGRMQDRAAWEFFSGFDASGRPSWSGDIGARRPVFEYAGRCQRVDAVYNPGLRRYLLAVSYGHGGAWGIYDAPEPWGPWTTAFHTEDWGLGQTHGYRLPAKWISAGGRTLHVIFSGISSPAAGNNDAFCLRRMTLEQP
jgi:hypothetical protein